MKRKLMVLMLLASGALFARTHVSIGVQIGGGPVVVNSYRPPYPGPGYVWIDGYYDGYGNWYDGYWALPPYAGAFWVAPRHYGGHFYTGHWGGARRMYRSAPHYAAPAYRRFHERGHERGGGRGGRGGHGHRR